MQNCRKTNLLKLFKVSLIYNFLNSLLSLLKLKVVNDAR